MAEIIPFIRDKGEARNWPAPQHLVIDRRRDMAELVEKALAAIAKIEEQFGKLDELGELAKAVEPEGLEPIETLAVRVWQFQARIRFCEAWLKNFRVAGYDRSQMAEILQDWDGEINAPSLALPEGIFAGMRQ